MKFKRLPAGFVIPAQPVMASKPPSGSEWVHEIKHDGYRLIVRRDGAAVRLYSRNAYDLTARLSGIAAAPHEGGERLLTAARLVRDFMERIPPMGKSGGLVRGLVTHRYGNQGI